MKVLLVLIAATLVMASCRSTRKIQTAIAKKDTTATIVTTGPQPTHEDTAVLIRETLNRMNASKIPFTTFSAKLDVDYQGANGKKYNVNGNLRMYKDSVIWISITVIFGIEGLRAYITPDSVKI